MAGMIVTALISDLIPDKWEITDVERIALLRVI